MNDAAPARRFSAIIAHRNGRDMLLATLAALYAALDPGRDEAILVDNGSSDDSVAVARARYADLIVIANGCNNGFAQANNQGIGVARGEFILLLNSDALLASDALDNLATHFAAHPEVGLIGARLLGADGRAQNAGHDFAGLLGEFGLAKARPHRPEAAFTGLREIDWAVGACLAARRRAIDQAGGLDGDFFFYYEDTEWCLRMRRQGWRVALAGDVAAVHARGGSTVVLRREALVEGLRSRLLFYRKVFPPAQAGLLIAYRVLRLILGTALHGTLNLATLGRVAGLRRRALRYAYPLYWLLNGMPEDWGLPDRCPKTPR